MTANRPAATLTDLERIFLTLFYAIGFKRRASSQNAVLCPEKKLFPWKEFNSTTSKRLKSMMLQRPLRSQRWNRQFSRLNGSIDVINLHQGIAGGAIGSSHDRSIGSS